MAAIFSESLSGRFLAALLVYMTVFATIAAYIIDWILKPLGM